MGRRAKEKREGDPKVAVAYLRVSTDDQDLGPEAQRAAIEAWTAREGIAVTGWYEDRISGAAPIADRPAFLDAIAEVERAGAGVLVVHKRDRLARDVVEAALAERAAEKVGAVVRSAVGDTGTGPDAQLFRRILDAFAEHERLQIGMRTRAALAAKRAKGERIGGRAPYGYRWTTPEERGEAPGALVEVDSEQAAIARIEVLRRRRTTIAAIAKQLNADGVASRGRAWHATTVARVLNRSSGRRSTIRGLNPDEDAETNARRVR